MAETEKKSKGQKRYGNPPKIKDKGKPGEAKAEAKEKPDEGGDAKLAGKSDDAPSSSNKMDTDNPGSAPKADVMAGTDGISIQSRHADEREAMAARHAKAVHQMHLAHSKEHAEMIKRHAGDMRSNDIMAAPGSGGSPAPDAGAGT